MNSQFGQLRSWANSLSQNLPCLQNPHSEGLDLGDFYDSSGLFQLQNSHNLNRNKHCIYARTTLPGITILIVQVRKSRSRRVKPHSAQKWKARRHEHLVVKMTLTDSTLPASVMCTRHCSSSSTARIPPDSPIQPTLGWKGAGTPRCVSVVFRLFLAKGNQDPLGLKATSASPTPRHLNYLKEFELGALPIKRDYQRETFFLTYLQGRANFHLLSRIL